MISKINLEDFKKDVEEHPTTSLKERGLKFRISAQYASILMKKLGKNILYIRENIFKEILKEDMKEFPYDNLSKRTMRLKKDSTYIEKNLCRMGYKKVYILPHDYDRYQEWLKNDL